MTPTASYVKARAEVRLTTARTDYRFYRGQWREHRTYEMFWHALVARERWNTLHELLSDPDWSSLRANGLDADDLALLTRDGAA